MTWKTIGNPCLSLWASYAPECRAVLGPRAGWWGKNSGRRNQAENRQTDITLVISFSKILNCRTVRLLYMNEFGIRCSLILVLKNFFNYATLLLGGDKCVIFGSISVTVVVCIFVRSIEHVLLWMRLNAAIVPFIEIAFRITEFLDTVS